MSIRPYTGGVPSRDNPENFPEDGDALMTWLATQFVTDANALAAALTALAAGTAFAVPYQFSTTTTDADPTAGRLRLNSATQNTSTVIRTDLTGTDGKDWTAVLDTFDDSTSTVKGQIRLVKLGDATKWLTFNITSMASPAGYRNITVTPVASSDASPFADGDDLIMLFSRTGDKGDTGATGPAGANGISGNQILLAALTPIASPYVDALNVFTSTYDNYLIIGRGLNNASGTAQLQIQFANAGVVDPGSNYQSSATVGGLAAATTFAPLSNNVINTGKGGNFDALVSNVNSASGLKSIRSAALTQSGATPAYNWDSRGSVYTAANAVSGVRLLWSGGQDFAAQGLILIIGIKNS